MTLSEDSDKLGLSNDSSFDFSLRKLNNRGLQRLNKRETKPKMFMEHSNA